jgi:hypothetical protein
MRIVFGLLAIAALAASTANAGTVLGINSVQNGGGVYVIDTGSGLATLLESTAAAALGTSASSGNGLAQADNQVIYYSSFGAAANDTLFASVGGTPVAAGSLVGNVASGTFGAGSYWYIAQNSPFLHQVTFNGSGTSIVTDTAFALSGDVKPWAFGDIAASADGSTIYGVAVTFGGQELFSIDLNTFTVTTIASLPLNLQVAFSGSELIGLNTTTGNIYSVDLTTGALTFKSTLSSATGETLRINDLASYVVPEPTSMALLGIGLTGLLSVRRFLSRSKLA